MMMGHLSCLMRALHIPRNFGPLLFASSTFMSIVVTASRMRHRTISSTRLYSAPVAKKVMETIYFGLSPLLPDQYRGPNVMDPPRTKQDCYNWLRDETREDETVLSHIRAENSYCEKQTEGLLPLQKVLYEEMLSHLKETDEELPYPYGPYYYYSRTVKGKSYKIHCRKPLSSGPGIDGTAQGEQVVIDENILAEGKDYLDVSTHVPSPDHSLLAYAVDYDGSETYVMAIKNIDTGAVLMDVIEDISGEIVWGADSSTLYYLKMDDEHRPNQLYMHVLGTSQDDDVCFLTEDDNRFWMGLDKTNSDRFLVVGVESKETSENYVIDLQGVKGGAAHTVAMEGMKCLHKREQGIRYDVEHRDDTFYIITNKDAAKNNKLMSVPISKVFSATANTDLVSSLLWSDVKPYNPKVQIDSILPFKEFSIVSGREDGLERVWVMQNMADWRRLEFAEASHSVWLGPNYDFDSKCVRLGYSSLITPKMSMDHNILESKSTVLKEQEVPLYDPTLYKSERIKAMSRDGREIPISLVYRKSFFPSVGADGLPTPASPAPLLLYGYGSYGACMDPTFDYKRTVLLDRGVVYAIAHIRGGGEMGRHWYEDEGKYLTKMNTFNDFADVATHLSSIGLTSAKHTAIVGRSAGGLLIGACVNMFPSLFKAAVADVPFVDVINTMSDPSIPLTATEWEEWGNPNEDKYFEYMESYSPYDNVKAQDYPAILVTAGLNDPRVAYWEPAKWVAKLRALKTDKNLLLLKTDLSSGHFSASDRYKFLKETAFEYSFILDQIVDKK